MEGKYLVIIAVRKGTRRVRVCRVGVALRVHQGLRCWTIALENLSLPALGHAAVVLGLQNIAMCILSVLATTAAVRARQSCSCVSRLPLERMPLP